MDREELLRSARNLYENPGTNEALKFVLEETYPELKESEDERIRKELIKYLTHRAEVTGFIDEEKDCKRWIAYLEKQKEQKAEWSEEDEKLLDAMIDMATNSLYEPLCPRGKMIALLKSLRPKPQWKPSEEQMNDLDFIITALRKDYCDSMADFLESLYHDLQKLR